MLSKKEATEFFTFYYDPPQFGEKYAPNLKPELVKILHSLTFKRDQSIAIVASNLGKARHVFHEIYDTYRSLPPYLQQPIKGKNSTRFDINGSTLMAVGAQSMMSLRGSSLTYVFVDRMDIQPATLEKLRTCIYPVVATRGSYVEVDGAL